MVAHKPLTWVEINKEALEHNISVYKNLIGPHVALAPVLKSNAYGHGLLEIASLIDHNHLVSWICVVSLSEAIYLRKNGTHKPLLVLSIIDEDLLYAVQNSIDIVLYDLATAYALNECARKNNAKAAVHIKIDTGLSRLGLLHNVVTFIQDVARLPHILLRGVFTHFADSESNNAEFALHQIKNFDALVKTLEECKISIPLRHSSCSAAIPTLLQSHYTMARAGIGIYGLWPSHENKINVQKNNPYFELRPVLSWKTKIIQIKEIPAGSYVGYDRTYQTPHNAVIAVMPVGYWDGYDRLLSNKGNVVIKGQLAPVRGRIAMNLMMVEITHIAGVSVYDEVALLSSTPGSTAQDIAEHCKTIHYEIVTRINPLLPRIIR